MNKDTFIGVSYMGQNCGACGKPALLLDAKRGGVVCGECAEPVVITAHRFLSDQRGGFSLAGRHINPLNRLEILLQGHWVGGRITWEYGRTWGIELNQQDNRFLNLLCMPHVEASWEDSVMLARWPIADAWHEGTLAPVPGGFTVVNRDHRDGRGTLQRGVALEVFLLGTWVRGLVVETTIGWAWLSVTYHAELDTKLTLFEGMKVRQWMGPYWPEPEYPYPGQYWRNGLIGHGMRYREGHWALAGKLSPHEMPEAKPYPVRFTNGHYMPATGKMVDEPTYPPCDRCQKRHGIFVIPGEGYGCDSCAGAWHETNMLRVGENGGLILAGEALQDGMQAEVMVAGHWVKATVTSRVGIWLAAIPGEIPGVGQYRVAIRLHDGVLFRRPLDRGSASPEQSVCDTLAVWPAVAQGHP